MIENGKHDITDALISLQPEGRWSMTDVSDYSTLTWSTSEIPIPTEDECNAEIARLDAKWIADEYKRQRGYEYPDFATQLDYIYHNGVDKWKTDLIDPVKNKYPKPS